MNAATPAAFPWSRVPRVTRAAIEARHELFARLLGALDPTRIAGALSHLLGEPLEITRAPLLERRRGEVAAASPESSVALEFPEHALRLTLQPEADLVRACVARLLEQEFELGWADTGIDAALRGAFAALALEAMRRAARREAPELTEPSELQSPWLLHGGVSLRLAGKPYRLELWVEALEIAPRARAAPALVGLARLGGVRIEVPWVAAVSSIQLDALRGLQVGDVWLPGSRAWWAPDAPLSAGLLVPARSERGLPVVVSGGRIVLGADAVLVHEELESSMSQEESELERIVGETPLVVRLELGVLELSAAEWAALRPGDVVQSGRRIDDLVVLRAAGREIARGELVDIEGELGVRVLQVGLATAAAPEDAHE
jgi:flagellar motor switch/type III secretory pathway protein FliN